MSVRLYRRAEEIRDSRFVNRQYLDAAVREANEARHRARGLHGKELSAAVTADQILAGIAARAEGAHPVPDQLTEFAGLHLAQSNRTLLVMAEHMAPSRAARDGPGRAACGTSDQSW
ncbi:DUF6545 domain-containing protein [Streptomyces scabiei]|uniref:DUF6545 domain-containing protein n=1 Tax=Streptomyces scabiei TaxID=1930 RepID=UPI0036B2966D